MLAPACSRSLEQPGEPSQARSNVVGKRASDATPFSHAVTSEGSKRAALAAIRAMVLGQIGIHEAAEIPYSG